MTTSPQAKRFCSPVRLVTHSGTFHADEALAIYMLQRLPEYQNAEVVRSRDPNVWSTASVLVDVGAEYVPEQHKYDHHQREFQDTFSASHKTRLSSAGLIYKHFGKRVLASILGWAEDDARLDLLHTRLYDDLIEGFDGVDNGVGRYPRGTPASYKDHSSLSDQVRLLNPFWNEDASAPVVQQAFLRAVELVGSHFTRNAQYLGNAWLPARAMVEKALKQRFGTSTSLSEDMELATETARLRGHIIVMESYCPWKDHLNTIESESEGPTTLPSPLKEGEPVPFGLSLYVVFPDPSGQWRVQAIPFEPDSFESRKALPAAWRGLRDANLDAVTGVPGGVFIHASGFIGGHQSKEGAIRLAEMAAAM